MRCEMIKEEKKRPAVRFKGFEDDWEQSELRNISNSYSGGTPSVDINAYYGGAIPFIRSAEINSQSTELFLTDEGMIHSSAKMVAKGDILYALYGATSGEVGRAKINGAINQAILAITPHFGYDAEFIMQWLRKNKSYIVNKFLQGGQGNLSGTIVNNLNIKLPAYNEQKCIGEFFSSLDDLITLHQRKLDQVKTLKKYFLQNMFPAEGENVPKIRLKDFKGYWKKQELGDVLEGLYNGQTPSRFNGTFWNGNINWLTSGELNRGIVNQTIEKITDEGMKDAHLQIVPKGTFVMAVTGLEAVGTRGNCAILDIDTTLNQSCMALFPKKNKLDTTFLFQWYRLVGDNYGIRFTQGTKQQSYNSEIIRKLKITLPEIEEQRQIGLYFSNLDNRITLHQRKIDQLQTLKKFMLQNLFI